VIDDCSVGAEIGLAIQDEGIVVLDCWSINGPWLGSVQVRQIAEAATWEWPWPASQSGTPVPRLSVGPWPPGPLRVTACFVSEGGVSMSLRTVWSDGADYVAPGAVSAGPLLELQPTSSETR